MAEHWTFKNPLMPPGEPVGGKTYRADGWAYFCPPGRFSHEAWSAMLDMIGEKDKDYVLIAISTGVGKEGPFIRGQMLVSPEAQERIAARRAVKQ